MRHHAIATTLLLAGLGLGCGPVDLEEGTSFDAVLGGDLVGPDEYRGAGFFSYHPWSTTDRACSASRIGPNTVITAGHCIGSLEPADYSFATGKHTTGARHEPIVELRVLSGFDLALMRTAPRCSPHDEGKLSDHRGLGPGYTLVSYRHEDNTRNGARAKVSNLNLTVASPSAHRLTTTMPCAYASVWGGDSGSPLYNPSIGDVNGPDELIGVARSVSNFCQSGVTTQTVHYVYLADPAIRPLIEGTIADWSSSPVAAACPTKARD